MRLRGGLRVLRRTATEVQVGTDPRWAVRLTDLTPAQVDRLCDATRPPGASDASRPREEADLAAVDPLLVDLLTQAHLTRADEMPVSGGASCVDARVWSLLRPDADGATQVRARSDRVVAVLGLGPTGLGIATGLAAAGVGTILLDDDGEVRPVDVGPSGYRWTDVGAVRAAVAARLLRDVAPQVATDSARAPDVVVLVETDVADPDRGSVLVGEGTAHLSVVVREADTVVGPFVVPGRGPCLRCLDLHRTDLDPAWPTLLEQLTGGGPAAEPSVTAAVASGLGTAAVLAHLDGAGGRPPGSVLEIAAPGAIPRERTWAVHPDCGCTALPTRP